MLFVFLFIFTLLTNCFKQPLCIYRDELVIETPMLFEAEDEDDVDNEEELSDFDDFADFDDGETLTNAKKYKKKD